MKNLILTALIFGVCFSGAFAETLDRVVAIVDDQTILLSELDAQIQIFAIQNKIAVRDPATLDSMRQEFLDKMIEDKVLLVKAERDSTIKVTNTEVGEALTQQINMKSAA
jgi:hypothetical protein